jgi:hypothetical protein
MMEKIVLRSLLKKLRALPIDRADRHNVMTAPQEILDLLAARAGIKPVCVLGRGFDDAKWIEAAVAIAKKADLHVLEGPMWNAEPVDETLPQWFREHLRAMSPAANAFYICKLSTHAHAVRKSFENQPITMEEEALLLGYPLCCVQAHYERGALLYRTFYTMLDRRAKGDVAEMRRLVREKVKVTPETQDEEADLRRATEFTLAPFTSFHICGACAADASRPAYQVSQKYKGLVFLVDRNFANRVTKKQEGFGR